MDSSSLQQSIGVFLYDNYDNLYKFRNCTHPVKLSDPRGFFGVGKAFCSLPTMNFDDLYRNTYFSVLYQFEKSDYQWEIENLVPSVFLAQHFEHLHCKNSILQHRYSRRRNPQKEVLYSASKPMTTQFEIETLGIGELAQRINLFLNRLETTRIVNELIGFQKAYAVNCNSGSCQHFFVECAYRFYYIQSFGERFFDDVGVEECVQSSLLPIFERKQEVYKDEGEEASDNAEFFDQCTRESLRLDSSKYLFRNLKRVLECAESHTPFFVTNRISIGDDKYASDFGASGSIFSKSDFFSFRHFVCAIFTDEPIFGLNILYPVVKITDLNVIRDELSMFVHEKKAIANFLSRIDGFIRALSINSDGNGYFFYIESKSQYVFISSYGS